MFSFEFRGLNSYDDFGIVISKRPPIPVPERRVVYEEVLGRDGSLTQDDGTYKDIILPIECAFEDESFKTKAHDIKAWLMGPMDKLILNDEPNLYYEAQMVNKFDIVHSIETLGEFIIAFNCKPFKRVVNEPIKIDETSYTNLGDVKSNPIIKITGVGNITFTINSRTFSLNNLNGQVTINSELEDAYSNTGLVNNQMTGEFPYFDIGVNNISHSGNITAIEIIPNTKYF